MLQFSVNLHSSLNDSYFSELFAGTLKGQGIQGTESQIAAFDNNVNVKWNFSGQMDIS